MVFVVANGYGVINVIQLRKTESSFKSNWYHSTEYLYEYTYEYQSANYQKTVSYLEFLISSFFKKEVFPVCLSKK